MKKELIFLAGFAVAAMSACTKSDEVLNTSSSESVISFEPLVSHQTRANYITTPASDTEKDAFLFSVYAWYTKGETFKYDESTTAYMDNVALTCEKKYDGGEDGIGRWISDSPYYWPKNGTLSFDAYYPTGIAATVSSTKASGLVFENFSVNDDPASQVDVLYATRVFDKSSSKGNNGGFAGVDIPFKHALSAIEVAVKTDADYNKAIKLNKITLLNVYNKGTFKQNLAEGKDDNDKERAWSDRAYVSGTPKSYELFGASQEIDYNTTGVTGISNVIVIPQDFAHSADEHVSIKVEYSIKHGSEWLDQENTFDLTNDYKTTGNESITAWEIGKRYKYTFTISLDQIYFAPSVEDWKDVDVNPIEVK